MRVLRRGAESDREQPELIERLLAHRREQGGKERH